MADNFTNDDELLMQYVDGMLPTEEAAAFEQRLQNDAALKEQYNAILLMRSAIRNASVADKVRQIHMEVSKSKAAVVPIRSKQNNSKIFMRIAAVLILVVAGYGVFKYSSTTNEGFYDSGFVSYYLPVLRGDSDSSVMIDSLYRNNAFDQLVKQVNAKQNITEKEAFLAGLASLQLNNGAKAVSFFEKELNMEQGSGVSQYKDAAEYYLSLAYIKTGNIKKAKELINAIASNPKHTYNQNAKKLNGMDLTILEWKND